MEAGLVKQMGNVPALPMQTTADVFELAKAFAQAGIMGAKNPPEGLMALKVVQELGIVAANERYNIMMGHLSKKAHAICADFMAMGGTFKIVERTENRAALTASYGETKDMPFEFSWEDAQNEPFVYEGGPHKQEAELKKPFEKRNIKSKYRTKRSRTQMLWARVISEMGQTLCPKACEGMYPPEVVADFDDERPQAVRVQPKPMDAAAAAKAVRNMTHEAEAEEVTEPDYTICPIDYDDYLGRKWTTFENEQLSKALESDLDNGYKVEIQKVLDWDAGS